MTDVADSTSTRSRWWPVSSPPNSQQTRTFGTTTGQLLALADWLQTHPVTHVAMESTGVYWKPVYNLLEDAFSVYVVNARHIKAGCRVERPT